MMKKNVLITGASSGIGKECAKLFTEKGLQVIAVSRNKDKMHDLEQIGCLVFSMDITQEESIKNGFEQIFAKVNQIDILINNAGFTQNGFLEELTIDQLRYQFEVNIFGLIRITQMILPKMRAAKQGTIINVGSAGGDFTSAGASAYHASKYALESFTDGMRQELAHFGINVILIKPGGVETDFLKNAESFYPKPIAENPYGKMRENFLKMLSTILDTKNSSFPILKAAEVADAIYKSSIASNPKTRIRVGKTAKMMPWVKRLMSDKGFDKMIMSQLGLLK
ncbi:MAG: SDR family NAD(P)-dependent oxidoreductase [Saprospiraceae bacterium]|nr:SDR family NAD(P)-dependent oxidoreductase [Saprospiraceae bacterium]